MKKYYTKGWKCFNPDMTCRGFQYEVGQTYVHNKKIVMCVSGFHFHENLCDILNYYRSGSIVCEVEAWNVITGEDKSVCSKIHIIRRCDNDELNAGKENTGRLNTGNRNTGNWNTGNRNTGDQNTGHKNTGDWNKCSYETGFLNSEESNYIRVFNKPCKKDIWNNAEKPGWLYFDIIEFILYENMTDSEKKANPGAEIVGGYFKVLDYQEAARKSFINTTKRDQELTRQLPNFNMDIFEEIFGFRF